MAQKQNKTSEKKKSPVKRKAARKRRPKVYIPANKIIAFCSIIVIICTALLLLNTLSEIKMSHPEKTVSGISEIRGEKKTEPEKKSDTTEKSADAVQEVKVNQPPVSVKSVDAEKSSEKTEPLFSEKKSERQPDSEVTKNSAAEKKPASDIPAIPPAVNGARLVLVFDDGGQNLSHLEKYVTLPFPITVAVLPKLAYSRKSAERVRKSGNELILHQPMQAVNLSVNPGPGAITPEMSLYEIELCLKENLSEIGPVSGMNNHEGSLICEDEMRIGAVLRTASEAGIYFIDSRTTSQTRVPQAAMSMGLSYYERTVFLDNTKKRSDIIAEFMKGVSSANKNGAAILIGHVWSADVLPAILTELYPLLKEKGYVFTTVSKSGALITP